MLIYNIDLWRPDGGTIQNAFILTDGEKVVKVGTFTDDILASPELRDHERLNGGGATAYPGFIDGHCHLGMFGDGMGFEGDDGNEDTDPCTPQLRAIDAVNPMDRGFAEALCAGITTVVTGPGSANVIGGQMCAVKTAGRFVDSMVVKAPAAMKIAFGENPKTVYNGRSQMPTTRMATAAMLREQLFKAQKYMQDIEQAEQDDECEEPEFDIKCESLLPVLKRELKVHVHAHRADDIASAMRICNEFSLDYVLIHCTEGHLMADTLGQQRCTAVVGPVIGHRSKPELSNSTMKNAGILSDCGVEVAICTDHPEIPIDMLAISAGLCVREGLSFDRAMMGITIVPARQCSIEDRVGSIEPGKDADIVLFTQNPFTIDAKPEVVVLNGKIVQPGQ